MDRKEGKMARRGDFLRGGGIGKRTNFSCILYTLCCV